MVPYIIEILSFSHIDFSLEVHASDFLAQTFSAFLSSPDRKTELLELLVLRDELSFPLKAVVREGNILVFVLEYISHREAAKLKHAASLLCLVRLHLSTAPWFSAQQVPARPRPAADDHQAGSRSRVHQAAQTD